MMIMKKAMIIMMYLKQRPELIITVTVVIIDYNSIKLGLPQKNETGLLPDQEEKMTNFIIKTSAINLFWGYKSFLEYKTVQ